MGPACVQWDNVQQDSACDMYGESVVLIPADEDNVALTEGRLGSMSHAAGVSPEPIDAAPVFVAARPAVSAQDTPADSQGPCVSPQPVRSAVTAATEPDLVASAREALPQQRPGCLAWPTPAHACELAGVPIEVNPAAAADTAPMQGRQPHLDHDSAEILHGSTSQGRVQSARSQYCKTFIEAFQLSLPGVPRTRDVSYAVRDRRNRRSRLTILQGVSGFFSPGEMAAVMGPSGSGKSTILDLLAGRKTVGEQEGNILFSGARPTQGFLKRHTGYVEQFDTLVPELTVREMLLYTAELKCPRSEPLSQKRRRVHQLLSTLALQGCAHTVIGNVLTRGISGGQAKRTNIGIALITNPQVLFLDEPTSGLDSYTTHEVMTVVRSLLGRGITICATIHCPPPHTFNLFDRVLIMQRGRVAYFGLNGQPAINYFYDHFEKIRKKGSNENLAEWIVDISTEADRQGSDIFTETYKHSVLKKQNDLDTAFHIAAGSNYTSKENLKALSSKSGTSTPMWLGLWVMLKYRTRSNYCSRLYLFGRIFDKACFSFATATFYLAAGRNSSAANVPNLAGLLYMWVILPAYGAGPYLPAIVMERPMYVRETSDGLYSPLTYLLYKMVEELTMAVLMSVGFAVPVFYACQMQGSFFVFWLSWLISLADGIAFAYGAAAVSPTIDIANCVMLTYPTVLCFAGGYILRWADIPRYWSWLGNINWLWYTWGATMINQYRGSDVQLYGGQVVLEYYSLEGASEWAFLGYAALTFVFFFAVTLIALVHLKHHKR
ncbi:hypothetical protein CVIRNUC_010099 [Coccomyxa viridis]|uniref:ABC transporter domain-containing protein n=1 Tax=Coccomyxa viridis TaxID=1274662 RepID=A0AAV1IKY1_9CHLO|nr:hypothetical protein CVIRNUC_010099 [Coccomyxa viridis]